MASQPQVAAHLFMSTKRFRELLDADVFERAEAGKYDFDLCRKAYVLHLRRLATGRSQPGGSAGEQTGYQEASRREKEAKAEMAELALAERRGELVSADDVDVLLTEIRTAVRGRLITLPSLCAPLIPSQKPASEIESIIRGKVDEALEALQKAKIETSPLGRADSGKHRPAG